MTVGTLKIWRLFVPAALMIIYGALLSFVTYGTTWEMPEFSKAPYLIVMVVPAVLYYITPVRAWMNDASHDRIAENLRAGLVAIAGYKDDKEKYSWKNLRSLFFKLVDEDKSLSTKASLAYFNGLIWTSLADSAAIALFYCLVSVALYYFGVSNALIAVATFLLIMVVSIIGNRVSTNRQINIGNEQLEHIRFEHKTAVERRLNQLD
ncbi:hypothetical protein [Rhizobium leguminosarum]|uniref:hypothetical protein n=1 Tax=Rhizobium leguminosarum TaxID=384 RepID=UPI001441B6A0|nr:hypothetical protein [Rhizobium leguminosarum]NKN03067.1 hypothetical protein [Rhizobium leguminosarum bv. viciae]